MNRGELIAKLELIRDGMAAALPIDLRGLAGDVLREMSEEQHETQRLVRVINSMVEESKRIATESGSYVGALKDAAISLLDGASEVQDNGLRYVTPEDLEALRAAVRGEGNQMGEAPDGYAEFSAWFHSLDPARYNTGPDEHDAAWMGWQAARKGNATNSVKGE